jgi:hypothetical protein
MLSQKLLADINVELFASGKRLSAAKIYKTCPHSTSIASFNPFAVV